MSPRLRTAARWLRNLLFGFVALALIGLIVQAWAVARDRADLPPGGRFVDVGGHRLHMIESGANQPGPVVVLECGIGGATAASWGTVRPRVAEFAHVIAYDRAGLGYSPPGPRPRDGARLADELHALLERGGLPPPYVLVGHSYGGLIARLFTARYPREVAGVVLLESSHPDQFSGARRGFRRWIGLADAAPWLARFGVIRLGLALMKIDADLLPEPDRSEQRAFLASTSGWDGIVSELDEWDARTNDEARATPGFGARPLAVLTAGRSAREFGGWAKRQQELAALSTDSIRGLVPGATHGSLIADSTAAHDVVRAIREVVEAVRSGRPLREVSGDPTPP